ncbi:hypothetical protein ABKN59_011744 [Abortiporus biennis]
MLCIFFLCPLSFISQHLLWPATSVQWGINQRPRSSNVLNIYFLLIRRHGIAFDIRSGCSSASYKRRHYAFMDLASGDFNRDSSMANVPATTVLNLESPILSTSDDGCGTPCCGELCCWQDMSHIPISCFKHSTGGCTTNIMRFRRSILHEAKCGYTGARRFREVARPWIVLRKYHGIFTICRTCGINLKPRVGGRNYKQVKDLLSNRTHTKNLRSRT